MENHEIFLIVAQIVVYCLINQVVNHLYLRTCLHYLQQLIQNLKFKRTEENENIKQIIHKVRIHS